MIRILRHSLFRAVLSALALVVPTCAEEPTIITFDVPGAGTLVAPCLLQGTFPYGINGKGEIGGNFQDANNVLHGFMRARDGTFNTFDAPGAGTGACQGTQGFAINSEGAVVGKTIDAGNVQHGMLRARDGAVTVFDAPGAGTAAGLGTFATNINPEGAVAGSYLDASGVAHGFLRAPDGAITAIDVPGAGTGAGQGTGVCGVDCISPEGAITGVYFDASNVPHGFLRTPDGTITTIDAPGAGTGVFQGTAAGGINPEGAIAGVYTDANNMNHGFLRTPDGAFTTFDVPGAGTGSTQGTLPSDSLGINPKEVITGAYVDANNVNHGFLRTPDGTITRFDAPRAGGTGAFRGTSPLGINREGAITGYYIDANNVGHGFLRTARRCGEGSEGRGENCERN